MRSRFVVTENWKDRNDWQYWSMSDREIPSAVNTNALCPRSKSFWSSPLPFPRSLFPFPTFSLSFSLIQPSVLSVSLLRHFSPPCIYQHSPSSHQFFFFFWSLRPPACPPSKPLNSLCFLFFYSHGLCEKLSTPELSLPYTSSLSLSLSCVWGIVYIQ